MANNAQALRPVSNIPSFISKERERDIEELTVAEKLLGSGAETPFWKALKKHIENQIQELEKINEVAIAQGLPLEEIGRNTIVISQTKGVITKIFNIVEDAHEATEERK